MSYRRGIPFFASGNKSGAAYAAGRNSLTKPMRRRPRYARWPDRELYAEGIVISKTVVIRTARDEVFSIYHGDLIIFRMWL
jgi:hypothetical protein